METAAVPNTTKTTQLPYDFDHPRLYPDVFHDMHIGKADLGPGDAVGEFDLPTTEGGRFRSSDLRADGRPVLVTFGSQTCPITESAAPGLKGLHARFGQKIRFVMLAVREAHPGASIPQPHTAAQKARHAQALRDRHALPFEVAVDSVDGALHRRLGSRPSSAYLVLPDGTIAFRAQWSNEIDSIASALEAVTNNRPVPNPTVTRTYPAMAKAMGFGGPVHQAAGKGATFDTWRIAPPFGMIMAISGMLFFLPVERRGGVAMAVMMAGSLAAGIAVVLAFS